MIFIFLIIGFITFCCWLCDNDYWFNWFFSFIVVGIITLICYFGFYESTRIDVEQLYAQQNNILLNYKTLTLNMNKIAVVETKNDKLIIDVANLNQSSNTSKAFTIWVKTANEYNLLLAREKGKREMGFMGKLWYGWRVPLKKDIKYIEIKLNEDKK